jgi:hypothetical protein
MVVVKETIWDSFKSVAPEYPVRLFIEVPILIASLFLIVQLATWTMRGIHWLRASGKQG